MGGGWNRESASAKAVIVIVLLVGIAIGLFLAANLHRFPFSPTYSAPKKSILPGDLSGVGEAFVEVAKSTKPAVVNISTTKVIRLREAPLSPFFNDPFFRRFFGEDFFRGFRVPPEQRVQSLGSGVIVNQDGYIITNNHVVEQASEIRVLLGDKREFTGRVVATDPRTDVAVVKISGDHLPTIPWGDSDRLQVGEWVLAIGNPFGLNQTVTAGIISATGRANVGIADYEDFIQTDAAINPGNSGGALVNVRGELIGINTAIFSRSGGYMGIGFAIPSNMAREVMEALIKKGKVTRGWLGVQIQSVTPELAKKFGLRETQGVLIAAVSEKSPAQKAGMKRGDIVLEFAGKRMEDPEHLRREVAHTEPGKQVPVKIWRNGKEIMLQVVIEELPKEVVMRTPAPEEEME
ncbi:MAG: DegQ family serine endoprotease [candidate division NC10 bacterium]|nr:DegQ family serine endoprotease [candidate division NC10 bacterium]